MANFDSINSDPNRLGFNIPKRKKSKLKKFIFFILFLAILGGAAYASSSFLTRFNSIFTNKKNIFTRVTGLIKGNDTPLKGEDTGIVNVLLLGIGGEGHDGAYLTDTMIVASINVKTNEVVMTSIPRDWFVTIPGHGYNKINAVYAYALQDNPGNQDAAGQAAIAAAEKVTGFDIPYYALIDFKAFVTAVDHVGGVDINVDNTFTDSTFPNDFPFDTKGYLSPVTFTKGPAHLSGKQALIFARSRHSSNPLEGSDFARSERQKKIIVAMKDKLTQLNVTNISTLNNLLSDFTSSFRTNLEPNELLRLASLAKNINGDDVYSLSLEPQGDLICDTTIDQLTGKPYIHPVTPSPVPTTDESDSTSTQSTTKSSSSTSTKTSTSTSKSTATPTPTPTPVTTPESDTTTPQTPTQIAMYIVEPCAGKTVDDIHNFLVDYWDIARLRKEGAKIEVQNSTGKTAASASWKALANEGLDITMVPFTGKLAFDKTILYDNTEGSKPKTLEFLRENESFTQADIPYTNSKADFVIIIGNDSLQ